MQTFLPYRSFRESAKALDNRRLGKQRVEAYQILRALWGETKGWRNHPATLMWHGHEYWLRLYHDTMIREWIERGFRNSMPLMFIPSTPPDIPEWLRKGTAGTLTNSHRSNLLRKDPAFYGKYGWDVPHDLPYYWPVTKEDIEFKRVLSLCS